jgi:uncharacterized protein YnzC (UPF0291/DUF896 family)
MDEETTVSSDNNTGTEQVADSSVPQENAGEGRNEQGQWVKGISGNPEGSKPLTEEEKKLRKATKEYIEDYKNKLAEALPKISPILIAKALEGDIQAIKEINDRVIGKPKQPITGGDEDDNPIRLFNYVGNNNGNSKDTEDVQENQSDSGRDIS